MNFALPLKKNGLPAASLMPEYVAPVGSGMNSAGAFAPLPRNVAVWNSLLRKRTASPTRMRSVAGKKRLSSVPFGALAGALPGEPAHALTVRAMALPGRARTISAAGAMSAAEVRFDTMQLLGMWGNRGRGPPRRACHAEP